MRLFAGKRDYMPAYHSSGTRALSDVKLIVLHSTESDGSAEAVAKYFQSPSSGGSAHLVVDNTSVYRCLSDNVIPWGAPGANTDGFHIEQVGYAAWSKVQWFKKLPMLQIVALKMAQASKRFDIPLVYVKAEGLKAGGATGVTTHLQVTLSGIGGAAGTHKDPGTGYPLGHVLFMARAYKKLLK